MNSYFILIALFNGIVIGISRAMNSQLSMGIGPFKASFWNHAVGFLFLTLVLMLTHNMTLNIVHEIPNFAYLGGFFGALFVAVNSYVFSKMGATKTVLLVISGQMMVSVLMDYHGEIVSAMLIQLLGVFMIIIGMYLSLTKKK